MRIPDNLDAFEAHDAEQERQLKMLPKCDVCKEYIQDEHYFAINGNVICPDCIMDYIEARYQRRTEDYMKG